MAFTKEELKKIREKEAKVKKEKELASAIHDAEVMDKMKSSVGAPTTSEAAMPAQPPAPVDPMGNVAGPAPTGMKKGGKVKKYEGGGSIRVDRSPKYSNSQMASVREQLDKNEKAAKPEHDKNVERYNKAMDEVTKRTQPGMAKMNPMGDTYKSGGKVKSASKRADGIASKGHTRGKYL